MYCHDRGVLKWDIILDFNKSNSILVLKRFLKTPRKTPEMIKVYDNLYNVKTAKSLLHQTLKCRWCVPFTKRRYLQFTENLDTEVFDTKTFIIDKMTAY